MSENKKYKILEKTDAKDSVASITVAIDKDFVSSHREQTINDLKQDVEVDGFRKGKAPEDKVIEKAGEVSIWEKNTFKAINTIIPVILQDEKVNVITMPNVSIVKLVPDTDPEIKIDVTLMPEVKLADYKKIAEEIKRPEDKEFEATEKDVEMYIDHLRKNSVKANHEHKHDKDGKCEECEKETELPEFNDEFVQGLGEFKTVDEFKKKLKEDISADKKNHVSQKRRMEIMEKIISDSKIEMPEVLIEEEQNRMLHEFKARVEGFKMNFEDYLKEIKKTEEDLKKEWRTDAEKRAKMNLVLPKIAREENIKADEKEVEVEVKKLQEQHKDVDENTAKLYVTNVLSNQKVFDYLDNL
jgi:FKBP-type peptidyl-prolyl cis-trans isomerase (trigger factor)